MVVGLSIEVHEYAQGDALESYYGDGDPVSDLSVATKTSSGRGYMQEVRYVHALQYYGALEDGSNYIRHIAAEVLLDTA